MRVRFAPSPTGSLHVGNARTALFNWLIARHYGGILIMRLEDTDRARSTVESENSLITDLTWLGLNWDEGPDIGGEYGPYRQTERLEIYGEHARSLVENDMAYPCFCTDADLEERREKRLEAGRSAHYDGQCHLLSPRQRESRIESGLPFSIRFHVGDGDVTLGDLVKGEITLPLKMIGDFIIVRSDGFPTYNFAVVIDDALMRITHVLRGEDHLSNTLRQILLYRAFDFPRPRFGHFGLITAPGGEKLSKRHSGEGSSLNYIHQLREDGYLPQGVVNYLALLGWTPPGDREVLDIGELIALFDLEKISSSPSAFDPAKLLWINGQHMRGARVESLMDGALSRLKNAGYDTDSYGIAARKEIIRIGLQRSNRLKDLPQATRLFFTDRLVITDSESLRIVREERSRMIYREFLGELEKALAGESDFEEAGSKLVSSLMQQTGNNLGIRGRTLWEAFRVALTGQLKGPELKDIVAIFTLEKVRKCIEFALTMK